jgi:ribonuclease P protein component
MPLNKNDKRLPNSEKIKLKREIEQVFSSKLSFFQYPIKLIVANAEKSLESPDSKVMFVVPKRKINKAFRRNLIRRRMREAYRLNKYLLPQTNNKLLLAFVYIGTDITSYEGIEQKIIITLQKLTNHQNK